MSFTKVTVGGTIELCEKDNGIHPSGPSRHPMVNVDLASTRRTVGIGRALLSQVDDAHYGIRKNNRPQEKGWKARGKKRKQWMKGR